METHDSLNLTRQIEHIAELVQEARAGAVKPTSISPENGGSINDTITDRIEQQLHTLNQSFGLSTAQKNATIEALFTFIVEYIHRTADYLKAFVEQAKLSNITSYTNAFLTTASDYFFNPHPIIDNTEGIEALLCQSYLCHRTLEELNDRIFAERQWPLAPCDTAHANLIAHTIIGDERANLLDQTVLINLELITAKQTEIQHTLFQQDAIKQHSHALKAQGWSQTLDRWPFLGEDMTDDLLK